MPMLNFRRAVVAAVFILVVFYLSTRSPRPPARTASTLPLPQPVSVVPPHNNHNDAALTAAAPVETEPKMPDIDSLHTGKLKQERPLKNNNNNNDDEDGDGAVDTAKWTLYERLAYAYPYDVQAKFPAYIWQTWKHTPAQTEFRFRDQEATWTAQHPSFIHEVITDSVATHMVRLLYAAVPEVVEAYDALPLPVLKADFFRYLVLYARGGVYSDIDTFALKSAVEWIPPSVPRDAVGLVIGIEADPDRPDWHDWYSRRIQFCQWTIQSKPGHPVLRDVVRRITQQTLKKKKAGELKRFRDKNVIEFTGPAVWTDAVFDYFNDQRFFDMAASAGPIDWRNFTGMQMPKRVGDVIVLPITSFSPGVQQMGAKDYDDPMAFVRHDFEGSWKPDSERHIGD